MTSARLSRRPVSLSAVLLAVLVTALGASAPRAYSASPGGATTVSATPAASGTPVFHLYGPQYMTRTRSVTLEQALADATEFGVITAKPDIYTAYLPAMRAANPALVVVAYLNAAMARPTEGQAFPADWYVKDASGVKVRSKYANYLMDVTKQGWIRNRKVECQRMLASSGYDGCVLDLMGPGAVNGPYGAGGQVDRPPVDARTGVRWTAADWMAATAHLADVMQAAVAPKRVYGNGVGDGVRYFGTEPADATSQLLTPDRSMIVEGFLRPGRAAIDVVPDLPTWQADVAMVKDAEARGCELLLTTKAWTTATAQQKDKVHEFSLGTYLLAAGGRTRWVFLDDEAGDTMAYHPWWAEAAQLGAPRGADFVNVKGLYQRNFVGGRVLVNPRNKAVTEKLGRVFVTLDGASVTTVTLPPHSAKVLRHP